MVMENNYNENNTNHNPSSINQLHNKAPIQNTNWTNNLNHNQSMNFNNDQNNYHNVNENYHNHVNIINKQNQNEIGLNSTNEISNRPKSNNHSRNVSFNQELTIPLNLEKNNQIYAFNDPYNNNNNNHLVKNGIPTYLNPLPNKNVLQSEISNNENINNFINQDISTSNISSKSLGEIRHNNDQLNMPATNNLSSSFNQNLKETISNIEQNKSQFAVEKPIIKDVEVQGVYPTIETNFKFDNNDYTNNKYNENLKASENNLNINNNNQINQINNSSNPDLGNIKDESNINKNNQFNFNNNIQDLKKESDFDFDFNGYDKVDTFKDIANKKGEDLFKNANNNFESDWDF